MHKKLLSAHSLFMAFIVLSLFIFSCTADNTSLEKEEEVSFSKPKEFIPSIDQQQIIGIIELAKQMKKDTVTAMPYLNALYHTISEQYGKQHFLVATALNRKGTIYYNKGHYHQAIKIYIKQQHIQRSIYHESHEDVARIEHLMGACYHRINKDEKAIQHYQEAIRLRKKYKSNKLSRTYYQLGNLYSSKGDYKLADHYLQLAIKNQPNYAYAHHALGLVKYNMQQYEKAILHLDLALELYVGQPILHPDLVLVLCIDCPIHRQNVIIDIYNAKASANDELKRYEEALKDYQKAIEWTKIAPLDDISTLYNLYNNLSITYKKLDRDDEAIQLLEQSLSLKKEKHQDDFHPIYTATYNNLGDVFFKQKKLKKALDYYQLALSNQTHIPLSKDWTRKITLKNRDIRGRKTELLTALFSKAKGLHTWYLENQDLDLLETALHTLETCSQLIDLMRQEQSEDLSKLFWREQTRPIYEKAIEIAVELNQAEKAYTFFEKSKAALLLDALKTETAHGFIPKALAEEEKTLYRHLRDLEQAPKTNKKDQLEKILDARRALDAFKAKLEIDYPKYYDVIYNIDSPNLSSIQQQLIHKKTTLIEYILIENDIYALVVDKDVRLQKIPKPTDFENNIQQFVSLMYNRNQLQTQQEFNQYLNLAEQLYHTLIAPLGINNQRLMIVRDGILNQLPFEALVKDASINPHPYLLQDYVINYIYSSSVLLQSQEVERQSNGQLLAIAPIEFSHTDLATLDVSQKEVTDILSIIKGKKQVTQAATLSNFEQTATPFSILHLSTHASASDPNSTVPWIAFYDSLLLLPDIYHLNLNADLVVLSACETSKGDLKTGEGVMSLARGFAYAGVPSIITSLWEVNEQATSEIMQHFYKNIQAHQPKDVALQQAKLAYLEQHPMDTPYFWAAFIAIGNTDALMNLSAQD